jgi:hypothetical protein
MMVTVTETPKPPITMAAIFDTDDDSVDIKVVTGSITQADWWWRILSADGVNYIATDGGETTSDVWNSAPSDLDPAYSPIELVDLAAGYDTGNYTVQIYHVPSGSRYEDMPVIVF